MQQFIISWKPPDNDCPQIYVTVFVNICVIFIAENCTHLLGLAHSARQTLLYRKLRPRHHQSPSWHLHDLCCCCCGDRTCPAFAAPLTPHPPPLLRHRAVFEIPVDVLCTPSTWLSNSVPQKTSMTQASHFTVCCFLLCKKLSVRRVYLSTSIY